ncbi:hypothetical protein CAC42_3650 [Sphaceloma murrayae]|uniref:Uncharacterized protein n=1 Tax=Sphaceloma murrayae TaxID=2082308 RepID=A0A2K1QQ80_9PEZI|nr:hypothetical protein CAC42_3650 [Sphaceloma murrayae]
MALTVHQESMWRALLGMDPIDFKYTCPVRIHSRTHELIPNCRVCRAGAMQAVSVHLSYLDYLLSLPGSLQPSTAQLHFFLTSLWDASSCKMHDNGERFKAFPKQDTVSDWLKKITAVDFVLPSSTRQRTSSTPVMTWLSSLPSTAEKTEGSTDASSLPSGPDRDLSTVETMAKDVAGVPPVLELSQKDFAISYPVDEEEADLQADMSKWGVDETLWMTLSPVCEDLLQAGRQEVSRTAAEADFEAPDPDANDTNTRLGVDTAPLPGNSIMTTTENAQPANDTPHDGSKLWQSSTPVYDMCSVCLDILNFCAPTTFVCLACLRPSHENCIRRRADDQGWPTCGNSLCPGEAEFNIDPRLLTCNNIGSDGSDQDEDMLDLQ